jgi:hypothetical protein
MNDADTTFYKTGPGDVGLVEYRDFVAETVRSLFPDANELRTKWASRVGRQDVLDALARHGIPVLCVAPGRI